MLCQECQKRPATLHFKQFMSGQKSEVHLCDVCAKDKGYMNTPEENYSLHDLLSGIFNFDSQKLDNQPEAFQRAKELKCDVCGLSITEFKRYGKFGCAKCYKSFSNHLDSLLRRVHSGNTEHHGKIPKRQGGSLHTKKELESHRQHLKQLIIEEKFEEAALIRDKIKDLEHKIEQMEAGDQA